MTGEAASRGLAAWGAAVLGVVASAEEERTASGREGPHSQGWGAVTSVGEGAV